MSELGDEYLMRDKTKAWKHSRWVLRKACVLDCLTAAARAQLVKKTKPSTEYSRLKTVTAGTSLVVAIRRLCCQTFML